MNRIYHCPHCRAQNFATRERLRLSRRVALVCWRCGQEIERPTVRKESKRRKAKARKTKRGRGG